MLGVLCVLQEFDPLSLCNALFVPDNLAHSNISFSEINMLAILIYSSMAYISPDLHLFTFKPSECLYFKWVSHKEYVVTSFSFHSIYLYV